MTEIRTDEVTDLTDRILLEAQRAANRNDWGGALACADEVLKNDPTRAEAMYLVAQALRRSHNEGTALSVLTLASKLEPTRPAVWLAMAQCMQERHPRESYQAAQKALSLKPRGGLEGDTLSLLCNVSSVLGRHAEALEWADKFEAKCGLHAEVCHNKSFALMALGRWEEGWREFKASLGMPNRKARNYHAHDETPRWNPNKHENATVVLYGEQGLGDEIMYASMIDKAIAAASAANSRIIIECYHRNADLFRRSFDVPVYGTLHESYMEWPADEGVTHRLEFGGLGEFFGKTPFRRGRYLEHDRLLACAQDAYLGASNVKGPIVGLAWTGGSWETGRARRSVPFDDVLQLMRGQDCGFVNLEYEDRRKDLEFAPDVVNPYWATAKGRTTDELAALLVNLDLVIAVQTSVVDLCGALGVPCWALTDENPQWRYTGFFGDDTMGFYESVKVYRQKTWGDWKPVVNQVARDLKAWTDSKRPKPELEVIENDGWRSC